MPDQIRIVVRSFVVAVVLTMGTVLAQAQPAASANCDNPVSFASSIKHNDALKAGLQADLDDYLTHANMVGLIDRGVIAPTEMIARR